MPKMLHWDIMNISEINQQQKTQAKIQEVSAKKQKFTKNKMESLEIKWKSGWMDSTGIGGKNQWNGG